MHEHRISDSCRLSSTLDTISTVAVHTSAFPYSPTGTQPPHSHRPPTTLLPLALGSLISLLPISSTLLASGHSPLSILFYSSSGHPPAGHILALSVSVGPLGHATRSNPSVIAMDTVCHLHINIVHCIQTPSRSSVFLLLPSQTPFHHYFSRPISPATFRPLYPWERPSTHCIGS
jgi:hypothetical protein